MQGVSSSCRQPFLTIPIFWPDDGPMQQGKKTFIYGLVDPVNRQLRYVGKTVLDPRRRLTAHLWAARTSVRKRHLFAWLSSLQASGTFPDMFIIEEIEPGGDW